MFGIFFFRRREKRMGKWKEAWIKEEGTPGAWLREWKE
jgi:hypothetical protein